MQLRPAEIGPPEAVAGGAEGSAAPERIDKAVNGLRRLRPELSAATSFMPRQRLILASFAAGLAAMALTATHASRELALSILALPFAFVVLVRVAALWHILMPREEQLKAFAGPDTDEQELPAYSLLVPLYRETESARGLVDAMLALDYPRDRLEVFFITEEDDEDTRRVLKSCGLPKHMRILTVPFEQPRTKPKALNYSLTFASGDFVGVYDAEDIPDPQQLKRAVAAFRTGGPDLACVQAHLNIYNPDNFLARQFTLEYTALFDCILPALDRLKLPLPLGGTSNHFDRRMLEAAGAWDAFNVTEDADLGVRLARLGKRVAMIDSTTWEEAPETFRSWFGQRSRWIKGWIQTYLVHMRSPTLTLRELGLRGFAGFQIVFAGLILSALVHPLLYGLIVWRAADGSLFTPPPTGWQGVVWWFSWGNLIAGYAASIALVCLAVARRGGRLLVRSALGLPVYWLAISFAAYFAVIEIFWRPHHWIKTVHKGAGRASVSDLMKQDDRRKTSHS